MAVALDRTANSLIEEFSSVKKLLAATGPEGLQAVRDEAMRRFASRGLPTHKDEEFKYLSLRALEEGRFAYAYGATVDRHEAAQTAVGGLEAVTLAFVNGQYAPELSSAHSLPRGVDLSSLAEALAGHEEQILNHLARIATLEGRLGSTNDERFVDLNTAYLAEGGFVSVEDGIELEKPVHLLFLSREDHGPFAAHPRSLVLLGRGARARIVESHVGLGGVYFTNAVTEIALGRDAILEYDRFVGETPEAIHISTVSAKQGAGSTLISNAVNFGGRIVRNDVNVWIDGEHTETRLNGVSVGMESQVIDNHTRIDHAFPNCHSFEDYKSILGDRASGVFNGKIFVYQDAQKTDAKQTNQALLLSPHSSIYTKPQLEIFADDVKCTHGATVGQLREDALFYLRSRGIAEADARALLVYAFAAEVLEKITVADLKDALERALFSRLKVSEG